MLIVKGQTTDEQHIENHTAAPYIDFGAGIQLATNDLGCRVVGTAAARLEEIPVGHDVAQPKVGNLDIQVLVQKQIFWFQIPVHNLVTMAVLDSTEHLLEEAARLVLFHSPVGDDVVEQFSTSILENHDDLAGGLDHSIAILRVVSWVIVFWGSAVSKEYVQFDNVRMSQELKILNLTLDTAGHVAADEFLPRNDLQGNLLASPVMNGQLNLAKRPLPQRLDDLVGANALLRLNLLLPLRRRHGAGTWPGRGYGVSSCGMLRLMLMLLLLLLSALILLLLLMRGLLELSAYMGRGQGDGQLLVLEAARCHDGGPGLGELARGAGAGSRVGAGVVGTTGGVTLQGRSDGERNSGGLWTYGVNAWVSGIGAKATRAQARA